MASAILTGLTDIFGLPGISANVLTQRLEGLEASGIIERRTLPPPANVQVYALTPWGEECEPVVLGLARWALRSPLHDPRLSFSPTALMLSLKMLLVPERLGDMQCVIGLRLDGENYVARVGDGAITVARGAAIYAESREWKQGEAAGKQSRVQQAAGAAVSYDFEARTTKERARIRVTAAGDTSGLRVSELTGLDAQASSSARGWVDLDAGDANVLGKGSKRRSVPVGAAATAAQGTGREFVNDGKGTRIVGPNITPAGAVARYQPEDWNSVIRHG
eukprot:gene4946-6716_t